MASSLASIGQLFQSLKLTHSQTKRLSHKSTSLKLRGFRDVMACQELHSYRSFIRSHCLWDVGNYWPVDTAEHQLHGCKNLISRSLLILLETMPHAAHVLFWAVWRNDKVSQWCQFRGLAGDWLSWLYISWFSPVSPRDSSTIPLRRPTLLLSTFICHNYISVSHPDLYVAFGGNSVIK